MNILEVKDVTLELDEKKILKNLNIDFQEGYIHAIVGPNGAGKSTLSNTIMGLNGYRNFTGDILLRGKSIKNLSIDERAREGISLGWQEPARFEGISTYQFLKASAKDKSRDNIRAALNIVDLDPDKYLARKVDKTLSGGERKRIELASLYLMEPNLILMDEPDSGIDIAALEKMFDALHKLKKKGTTVILITHSMAVLNQADDAFLLCNGQITEKGSTEKISNYFKNNCIACKNPATLGVKNV